ncbi:TetR/AcrR family transcriptional regulator [Simkania negevensis]|uniref:TetR/AcrR family transcriptional regulator n=1 Tax=Simkania negevensis TaxID=83561 RepID=A0ABS3AR47_9BACT|nr:TetR/AcrR family transcriptional regulator [Simkania negevensis]
MSKKKRAYHSVKREQQAKTTRSNLLQAAKALFETKGFDHTTIDQIANKADVSSPTVYSLFKSKQGVLRALMDEVLPLKDFKALVEQAKKEPSAHKHLKITAKIARQIYDAEHAQINLLRGAQILSPELKKLEEEKEKRRYRRLKVTIETILEDKTLLPEYSHQKARDVLWALTGREMYRLLVIERKWSPQEYEEWLTSALVRVLLQ